MFLNCFTRWQLPVKQLKRFIERDRSLYIFLVFAFL